MTVVEQKIESVVFDMDGLLIDSEVLAMESLVSAGMELGYSLPIAFCRQMIGIPADECHKLVQRTYGDHFPVVEYFELHEAHLRNLVSSGRVQTKPGARELLDALDEQGIPKAIATSSGRRRAEHQLRMTGILDRFDIVVSREDVIRGKPSPEPYLKAVSALGKDPGGTIALEDSTNGLRAACAAGLRCILVPDLEIPTEESIEMAHRLYPNLYHVIQFISAVNRSYPKT